MKSLEKAKRLIQEYKDNFEKSVTNSIKTVTEAMYNEVLKNCYDNGIYNHTNEIHWEYDESSNTGKIWTNNEVIIFNEMGTGIVGSKKPHPAFESWEYDVNGHGEKGWWYPTTPDDPNPYKITDKNGQLRAWTKGLPSRSMFYNAFEHISNTIGDFVEVELRKTIGNLYEKKED